ncbi:MAG: DUF4034 domain-containing protein [Planctomycetota bacterium]
MRRGVGAIAWIVGASLALAQEAPAPSAVVEEGAIEPLDLNQLPELGSQRLRTFPEQEGLVLNVRLNALVRERDFAGLDALFQAAHARGIDPRTGRDEYEALQNRALAQLPDPRVFQAWVQARPESAHAFAAAGRVQIDLAWKARGDGFAPSVSKEGWKGFEAGLAQAKQLLERATVLGPELPLPWAHLEIVARGQGDRDRVAECFEEATQRCPGHYAAHEARWQALLRKWGGDDEAAMAFARAATKEHPGLVRILVGMHAQEAHHSGQGYAGYYGRPEVRAELFGALDAMAEAYPASVQPYDYRLQFLKELGEATPEVTRALQLELARRGHGPSIEALSRSFQELGRRGLQPPTLYWLSRAANAGQGVASFLVGRELEDPRDAFRYYLLGARTADPNCMARVGICYLDGRGVEQDTEQALKWLKRGEERGAPEAQNAVASLLTEGKLFKQDLKLAATLYARAEEQGLPIAAYHLGQFAEQGLGEVPRDLPRAAGLYRRALQAGVSEARERLLAVLGEHPELRQPGDPE